MAVLDQMTYCHCGSPATVIEAAGTPIARTASYEYEFKGKRWKTTTPEGSMSTNQSHVLIVEERNAGHTPQVTYTRGLDLSGTIEGAGGIGGLLMRSHGYSAGNWSNHNAYHSDANGNVTALMNSSGVLQASYKYNPYGGLISSRGSLAGANTMRFSSKPAISSTTGAWGFYYYGYRFYDPGMQRWLNRDPIEESGGLNVYGMVGKDPVAWFDPLGLQGGNYNQRTGGSANPGAGAWKAPMASGNKRGGPGGSRQTAQADCRCRGGEWVQNWEKMGYTDSEECWKKRSGWADANHGQIVTGLAATIAGSGTTTGLMALGMEMGPAFFVGSGVSILASAAADDLVRGHHQTMCTMYTCTK